MKPFLVINDKAYPQAIGKKALTLAREAEKFKDKARIIVCPPTTMLYEVASNVKIPVYAQHVDYAQIGSHTGHITPEELKAAGVTGSIINHSERRLSFNDLTKTVKRCRKAGIRCIVCVISPAQARRAARLKPDFIAYEPPELIGGDVSVTTRPKSVVNAVKAVKSVDQDVIVLCGAGIKSHEDFVSAQRLGAMGVLIASGIVKARNHHKAISQLLG